MRRRHQLEPAYLLQSRPYSDSSLLVEAFTLNHGRVGIVARGVRGQKSKLRALLQPLQPLLLSWMETGELGTLTGADAQAPAVPLAGDRVFYAWYLNELLTRLLQRHDAHPQLFQIYAQALPQLAGEAPEASLRVFEKHLLAEIGYGLHLDSGLDAAGTYVYDEQRGAVPSRAQDALSGASLLALRDEQGWTPQALADALKLLRPLIARQLGGRPLETARLLRELRGQLGRRKNDEPA